MTLIYLDRERTSEAPEHPIDFIDGVIVPSLLPLCFSPLCWCHEKLERKQSTDGNLKRTRNRTDIIQRGIPLSSLDAAEVGRVHPSAASKFLL